MTPLHSRLYFAALGMLSLLATSAFADPPEVKKEKQSAVVTGSGEVISSSALIKKLNTKLENKYQDLELVFSSCSSGEFATRAKGANGLTGTWSVSTSTDTGHRCVDTVSRKETRGGKQGLKIGETFFHGYQAQYIKKLRSDAATAGNRALHEFAEANKHQTGDDPNYESSGQAADDMTVRGGKTSNHAIVSSSAGFTKLNDEVVVVLKAAGYTDATVTYLTGTRQRDVTDGSKSDGAFSEAAFDKALDDLRKELDKNPGEEKAFIYFSTHGSYGDRTVAFADLDDGLPGSGFLVANATPTFDIFADSPELLVGLQEEQPLPGGGFWANDPLLQREGQPYLAFSTASEFFSDAAEVEIFLNDLLVGTLPMGNPDGSDYLIGLADELLNSLMSDIASRGLLSLSFVLPSDADFFRLAVEADYLSADKPQLFDYGVTIGSVIGSEQSIPEPGTSALLVIGLTALVGMRRCARVRARPGSPSPSVIVETGRVLKMAQRGLLSSRRRRNVHVQMNIDEWAAECAGCWRCGIS